MKALVYKSTGSWYVVKNDAGKVMNARIKGVFKIDGITSTNPIAVGDQVEVEMENEVEQTVTITQIYPRANYIARATPHQNRERHIVASNLDQLLLFATLKEPRTSQGFIDRFLVAAEAYHVPPVIVFNKADLYKKKELQVFEERKAIYEAINYKVLLTSIANNTGIDALKETLKDKTTLLSGHSGVGKSTFINAIFPDLALRTKEVSGWSGKGMHTTTFAEMFDLPFGGKIIDTPGIREFGITDIDKQELSHYYPEMREMLKNCQFNNCIHINEPGCAVKEAVEEEKIAIERYISYCNILDSMEDKHY
ncbi:ribosome small subunit-dependent GTPase A [Panacibacter sp. DH6]|uniref:Small ribosomal subunit biogenesis GTPase RsgA n=1 Tax=Panacibacter microcysteis TaxID=2793269 RepID=A0A931E4X4_9BACT|nr:ribosome small subunit-dependent GTPase A [Panacibacter microcysteis]MBG9375214.1 ribosome small subunit-dependent GTPase A [Panacibacter microcysteis]